MDLRKRLATVSGLATVLACTRIPFRKDDIEVMKERWFEDKDEEI